MNANVRRGAVVSGSIHLAALLALIITLPPMKLDNSDSDGDVGVVFAPAQQALQTGKTPAPKNTLTTSAGAFADQQPKPRPFAAPPPPPPPPRASTGQTAIHTPDTPPVTRPPQPQTPRLTESAVPVNRLPLPPQTQPPPQQSPRHQQHAIKTPDELSQTVDDTIAKFRAEEKQVKPPAVPYNPQEGGAPAGGGSPASASNARLSGLDRDAIGNHVRPCWGVDTEALNLDSFSVELIVQTDAAGIVRNAVVAPADRGKLGDPSFAAFAARAVAAIMNYQCATLPLPASMRGAAQTFLFDFKP